jgi:hypothetical protein
MSKGAANDISFAAPFAFIDSHTSSHPKVALLALNLCGF